MTQADASTLADRHFRPTPGIAPADRARAGDVIVRASTKWAASAAGQHALWMTVNLLARQVKVIREICIDVPTGVNPIPGLAPFGDGQTLAMLLADVVHRVAGTHVAVSIGADPTKVFDAELCVGLPPEEAASRAHLSVVIVGHDWRAFVGTRERAPKGVLPNSNNPVGPYLAASLGAGEIFKSFRGVLKGEPAKGAALSLWDGTCGASWGDLATGPELDGLRLPVMYLVGAGAVGQAVAALLGAAPGVTGFMIVIDDETLDDTNLNRYSLATLDDRDSEKTALVKSYLEDHGFHVHPYPGTWREYLVDSTMRASLPIEVRTRESDLRFDLVLSCVDDNGARHEIQNVYPKVLMGGSTDGLTAKAYLYDMLSDWQCLRCWNPVAERRPRFEATVEALRAMTADQRQAWAEDKGYDFLAIEKYLEDPKCGMLGERDIAKFASTEDPSFSVGFVSVAAGVMLASRLLRFASEKKLWYPADLGTCVVLSFWNSAMQWIGMPRETGCGCDSGGRSTYLNHWGPAEDT